MAEEIEIFSLSNGLRGVIRPCSSPVEYCGIAFNVGSRDEDEANEGLAHFVEHTIFKGTDKRRSTHIINRMESVGGELNAYTTKEETVVYSIFPAGHLERAVELIADLVINSRFPEKELEKEREVVCDEIDSYLDVPSEAVFDDFEDIAFRGSRLGHNILGNRKSVEKLTSQDCRAYLDRFYITPRAAFFYMGPSPADRVRRIASRYLSAIPENGAEVCRPLPAPTAAFDETRKIDSHQSHTVIGARIPDMFSPRRHTVALLANILGGPGMNSRLNVELREKRGLVYSVEASPMTLTDCGLLTIYFGCDSDDTTKCTRLVQKEIERMADSCISQRVLDAMRRQYLGQLAVASENHEQFAINTGRALLYRGHVPSPEEIVGHYMAISPENLRAEAEAIAKGCSRLTFGPT